MNLISLKLTVTLLVLIPQFAHCQSSKTWFKESDVYRFGDGIVYTYSNPTRWDKKDWMTLGGVLIATAGLTLVDEPVHKFWLRQDSKFLDGVERIGYHYGKPYSAFIATSGFYLTGLLINDRWSKDTGLALGVSLLTSGLLQTFLKDAIGRARPGTGLGAFSFNSFSGSPAYHSFPSGHLSVAFSISHVLARRINYLPVKIVFYSLAAVTAVARQYSEAHWVSDLAFAGSLAWSCAETAMHRINQTRSLERATSKKLLKVTPYMRGISIVVSL